MEVTREAGDKVYILGKGQQALECPMTAAERQGLELEITELSALTFAAEAEKKEAVRPINEKLKSLKSREQELVNNRAKGVVLREVPVRRVADFFRGESWVERLDVEPPAEVPDTRRSLTDAERQTILPGVVRDGDGPDAPVLDLFPRRTEESTSGGTANSDSERAPAALETGTPDPVPTRSTHQHPLVASPGEAVLHLSEVLRGEWCARWPTVGMDVAFHHLGLQLGSARWNSFGGEDKKGGWDRSGDTGRVPAVIRKATAQAILSGHFKRGHREDAQQQPSEGLGARRSTVEQVLGLGDVMEGWSAVVIAGELFFQDGPGGRVGGFRRGMGGLVRAPVSTVTELWVEEHPDLMGAAEAAVDEGLLRLLDVDGTLDAHDASYSARYALPQPKGMAESLKGWQLEVVNGRAFLHQPDGTRVGPFKWNAGKGLSDRAGYAVTDEWMEKHGEDVLPALDELLMGGTVLETFEGYTKPASSPTAGARSAPSKPHAQASADAGADEDRSSDTPVSASEASAIAEKLSGYAPKVLLLLRQKGPQPPGAIGVEVGTARPGMVLHRLEVDGLVVPPSLGAATYSLSTKGIAVAAALAASGKAKRK